MIKIKENLLKTSLCLSLLVSIFLSNFSAFARDCEEIRESTLRLHILASSDSEEDQRLKLLVRDEILKTTGELFLSSKDKNESIKKAQENMDSVLDVARSVLRENGCNYTVSGEIVEMFFENRSYGDITLPAGRYNALRIIIGEGKGKNWWCVLFPPLCIPSATKTDSELLEPVRGEGRDIKVRLWIVEFIEEIKEKVFC